MNTSANTTQRVAIAVESRFDRTPDGATWTKVMNSYALWQHYLEVFDEVLVIARVRDVPSVPSDWVRVDGDGVSVHAVPTFIGPQQYLRKARSVRRSIQQATNSNDAVISQGGTLGSILTSYRKRHKLPYAMEVIGDPWDMFAPGSVQHPLRAFFRRTSSWSLRRHVANAQAVTYVTASALQKRYPAAKGAFTTSFSDVQLPQAAYVTTERVHERYAQSLVAPAESSRPFTLVTIGTMAQMYKAPDIQIQAVKHLTERGHDVRLKMIGDGRHRPELEALAAELGIGDRVIFMGQLTAGQPVRDQLDQADIFLLPSRAEGLPRALVEAMARGLPAVGSTMGGIPELLAPEDLVPANDVVALATKIEELIASPQRRYDAALRNLDTARHYQEDLMNERRRAFLKAVRDAVQRPQMSATPDRDAEAFNASDAIVVPAISGAPASRSSDHLTRPNEHPWSDTAPVTRSPEPTLHDAG